MQIRGILDEGQAGFQGLGGAALGPNIYSI